MSNSSKVNSGSLVLLLLSVTIAALSHAGVMYSLAYHLTSVKNHFTSVAITETHITSICLSHGWIALE